MSCGPGGRRVAEVPHPRDGLVEVTPLVGALGRHQLQARILRAITPARVFAVDVREAALELAHESGAELTTLARPDTHRVLRAANGGAVLDFVGSDSSLALGVASLRAGADLVVVGSGGGRLTVGKGGRLPAGVRVSLPFWGTRAELREVVALARDGRPGIGAACARTLAQRGATVAVADLDPAAANAVAGEIGGATFPTSARGWWTRWSPTSAGCTSR